MAEQEGFNNAQESAADPQATSVPPLSDESQVKKKETTNTGGSSKIPASGGIPTNNDHTKSTRASAGRTMSRTAITRTVTSGGSIEKPPKETALPEPAQHKPAETPKLRLISSGNAESILVDVVAIPDYRDDASTAWTFNLEHLRKQSREHPMSSARSAAATSSNKKSAIPHDVVDRPLEDEHSSRMPGMRSGDRETPGSSKKIEAGPSTRRPIAGVLKRALALEAMQNNANPERNQNEMSMSLPKTASKTGPAPRRRSQMETHTRQVQDEVSTHMFQSKEHTVPFPDQLDNLSVNWLADPEMFPAKVPWARIFNFEYPRDKDRTSKPPNPEELTKQLATELLRRLHPERPIIFVTRGFGFAVVLELLFSESPINDSVKRWQLFQSITAVFNFRAPADAASGNVKALKTARLPYDEIRRDYVYPRSEKVEERLRNLTPSNSPKPFVQHLDDDGRHFKDMHDNRFVEFIQRFLRAARARIFLQAAIDGKEDELRKLEAAGWDVNLSDSVGQTALHFAVISKDMKVLSFLLGFKGIRVDAKDAEGQTALHYALMFLSRPHEAIAMLVDNGADATTKDNNGSTVLDLARKRKIQQSLKTFLAVTGPSSDPGIVLQLPKPDDLDELKQLAAEDTLMAVAEFFKVKDGEVETEKFIIQRPSVFQVLYRKYPHEVFAVARHKTDMKQDTRVCRWLHIPANHTGWVDGLFARLGLAEESIQVDQHSGKTYWSNYLRPHCRTFKAVRKPLPSTPERLQHNSTVEDEIHKPQSVEECTDEVHGTLIYMPFLTSERHCDQSIIYNTVIDDKKSPLKDLYYVAGRQFSFEDINNVASDFDSVDPRAGNDSDLDESQNGVQEKGSWFRPSSTVSIQNEDSDPARLRSEREMLYAYRDSLGSLGRPLHIRRTLDQSHYLMLEDTRKRDRDQVVLRRQQGREGSKNGPASDSPKAEEDDLKDQHPMVMVDQLWLWIVGDTVISSFPRSWPQPDWTRECDVLDRLIRHINDTPRRGPIRNSHDLADLVLKHCVEVFNHPEGDDHYHPLSLHDAFETSVGVVADQEMSLFRQFEEHVLLLNKLEVLKGRQETAERLMGTSSGSYYTTSDDIAEDQSLKASEKPAEAKPIADSQETENELLDKLFDIKKEIEQLDEAKDIRDELRMILRILEEQKRVMDDWFEISSGSTKPDSKKAMREARESKTATRSLGVGTMLEAPDGGNTWGRGVSFKNAADEAYATVQSNHKDFTRMLEHVVTTEKGINQLLNLKQKEANSLEARFARKSAEAATKQGNTILFFTIVTIIFGSLSFITTFFALNVTAFPLDADSGEPVWPLRQVIGLIIGLSLGLSIPFVVMALTINSTMALGTRALSKAGKLLGVFHVIRFLRERKSVTIQAPSSSGYLDTKIYIMSSTHFSWADRDITQRRGSNTSFSGDEESTAKMRTGWMARAGLSLRRLGPKFRSQEEPSEHVRSAGRDQERVYYV
ncbi:hypothetical protein ABEF95_008507 [Exophiala dermatitidis]